MPGPFPSPEFMEKVGEIIRIVLSDQSNDYKSNQK